MGKVQKEFASINMTRKTDGLHLKVKLSPELYNAAKGWANERVTNKATTVPMGSVKVWAVHISGMFSWAVPPEDETLPSYMFPVLPDGQDTIEMVLNIARTADQCKNFVRWATEEYRRLYLMYVRPFTVTGSVMVEQDEPTTASVKTTDK